MANILRKGLNPGDYTIGSPDERTEEKVQKRHESHDLTPWIDGFQDGAYEPPLGKPFTPLFVAGVDGVTGARTWAFGDKVYNEPEWLRPGGACEHIYTSASGSKDKAYLEFTVLLRALARGWKPPN